MTPLTPSSPFPCRFSRRYHGVLLKLIPAWYLALCYEWRAVRDHYPELIDYIDRNKDSINSQLPEVDRI